jgi:hypothetical protein
MGSLPIHGDSSSINISISSTSSSDINTSISISGNIIGSISGGGIRGSGSINGMTQTPH